MTSFANSSSESSSKDTVSVILPYFNREDSLQAAALSVLEQTYSSLKLYMINDASTDRSRELARSLDDPRVTHIDATVNGGVCRARNLGIDAAETNLIAFMDSDDLWLPQKLQVQLEALRRWQVDDPSIGIVGCAWRLDGEDAPANTFYKGPFDRENVFWGVAGTGTPMLLLDLLVADPDARFDPSFPALVENDYKLSSMSHGTKIAVVSQVLAVVSRGRPDHVANAKSAAQSLDQYLLKYDAEFLLDEELHSHYKFRAARQHILAKNRRRALRHFKGALKHKPIRRSVHLGAGLVGHHGLAVAQKIFPL